jgi:hypothetical protein
VAKTKKVHQGVSSHVLCSVGDFALHRVRSVQAKYDDELRKAVSDDILQSLLEAAKNVDQSIRDAMLVRCKCKLFLCSLFLWLS